jgi:hypothetical protein
MPIRVQDEQGGMHVFPDQATPEMIAQAMGVKPPSADVLSGSPADWAIGELNKRGAKISLNNPNPIPSINMKQSMAGALQSPEATQTFLSGFSRNMGEEAQRQVNMVSGPESEGRSTLNRTAHAFLSYVPSALQVAAKTGSGLVDWKTDAALAAGAVDPAIPAAYFAATGAAAIPKQVQESISRPTPENVQDALLTGATVAGASAGGMSTPRAGILTRIPAEINRIKATPIKATVPGAEALPDKAVAGVDDLFRGASPRGGNPRALDNMVAAAGDLAEIGKSVDLSSSKGGNIAPDMRVRATVNAARLQLDKMYNEERLPQIQRHEDNPVAPPQGEDSTNGLSYIAEKAGTASDRAVATKAISGQPLTLGEADQLGRVVNSELHNFESLTGEKKAAMISTDRRINGLKQLDSDLSSSINGELQRNGEPGIAEYERRYAGLSAFRTALETRMNGAELMRTNPALQLYRALVSGSRNPAALGQAAVSDVRAGKFLQSGLKKLADSGITPNRGTSTPPPTIRGLLHSPIKTLAQSISEPSPIAPASSPQPTLEYRPIPGETRNFVAPGQIKPAPVEGNMFRDLLPQPEGSLFDLQVGPPSQSRIGEFLGKQFEGKIELGKPEQGVSDISGKPLNEHIIYKNGEPTGSVKIIPGDKSIHVDWLEGDLGTNAKKQLIGEIKKAYPEATQITYERVRRVGSVGTRSMSLRQHPR